MDAKNKGNSFHFGVNFELDDTTSSQELGEEELNKLNFDIQSSN